MYKRVQSGTDQTEDQGSLRLSTKTASKRSGSYLERHKYGEIQRVKPIQCTWRVAEHPLVDVLSIDRSACVAYVERELGFTPYSSSCIICPFHDNKLWLEIKKLDPNGFKKACELDELIRQKLKYKDALYLHKTRNPLKDVDLQEDQITIDDFINECEGFCGN